MYSLERVGMRIPAVVKVCPGEHTHTHTHTRAHAHTQTNVSTHARRYLDDEAFGKPKRIVVTLELVRPSSGQKSYCAYTDWTVCDVMGSKCPGGHVLE